MYSPIFSGLKNPYFQKPEIGDNTSGDKIG
jgi:hypothetical protein